MKNIKAGDRVRVPVRATWTGTAEHETGTVTAVNGPSVSVQTDGGNFGHWFIGMCIPTTDMQECIIKRAQRRH